MTHHVQWGSSVEARPCIGCGDPAVWGPPLWQELHSRAKLPREHYDREFRWLELNFIPRIPCAECREHLRTHLDKHPLPERNEEYHEWTVEYHNVINAKLGKPRWAGKNK